MVRKLISRTNLQRFGFYNAKHKQQHWMSFFQSQMNKSGAKQKTFHEMLLKRFLKKNYSFRFLSSSKNNNKKKKRKCLQTDSIVRSDANGEELKTQFHCASTKVSERKFSASIYFVYQNINNIMMLEKSARKASSFEHNEV